MKTQSLFLAIALALAVTLGVSTPASAAGNAASGVGIGIQIGDPSGLSFKFPMGRANAVHAALGYDLDGNDGNRGFGDNDHLYFGADYTWYNYSLFPVKRGKLPLYYGPGAYVVAADRSAVGIRGVVGIEYQFSGAPFDVFLELGPRINVVPDTDGDVFVALGGRFFF